MRTLLRILNQTLTTLSQERYNLFGGRAWEHFLRLRLFGELLLAPTTVDENDDGDEQRHGQYDYDNDQHEMCV